MITWQPALALKPHVSRPNPDKRFPKYEEISLNKWAEKMLPCLCFKITVRLNPAVALICLQERNSLFECVMTTALLDIGILPNPSQRNQASPVEEIDDASPNLSRVGAIVL